MYVKLVAMDSTLSARLDAAANEVRAELLLLLLLLVVVVVATMALLLLR